MVWLKHCWTYNGGRTHLKPPVDASIHQQIRGIAKYLLPCSCQIPKNDTFMTFHYFTGASSRLAWTQTPVPDVPEGFPISGGSFLTNQGGFDGRGGVFLGRLAQHVGTVAAAVRCSALEHPVPRWGYRVRGIQNAVELHKWKYRKATARNSFQYGDRPALLKL